LTRAIAIAALWIALGLAFAARPAQAADEQVRVATLLPFVDAALARTQGNFEVVATVRRELRVPVEGAIDLGNPHSPNLEGLAQARPTLVVADRDLHAVQAESLRAGGAELLLLDTRSIDATLAGLDEVGKKVGASDAMARETAAVRARLAELALAKPMLTLAVFGAPGSFLVVTERTWLGDLLDRLDFANVGDVPGGDERFPGLISLSDETLASLRPELVLLVAHGNPAAIEAAFEQRTAAGGPWSGLRADADRGVHALDPALFAANPGLDVARAAEALVGMAQGPDPTGGHGVGARE
jgi:iron complex transport system substrate-binding protein